MSATPAPASHASRLGWLDVVRGLAAIIVYLQHTLERDWKFWETFSWNWVNCGRVGVTAFFLVSGFVIPFSLERANSLKKFWVSRLFRLYPLYWVAMAATLICAAAGYKFYEVGFDPHSAKHLLVNVTMVQQLVRIPNALPVFWTLGIEMLFYWMISAAFAIKKNERSLEILYLSGGAVLLAGVATPLALGRPFPGIGAMFLVVTATFGTVFYRYSVGKYNLKQVAQAAAFVVLIQAALSVVAFKFSTGAPGSENELIGPMARIGSAIVGYALFFGVYAFRNARFPAFLKHLGLISYSVYLIHPFVWYFSPKFEQPLFTLLLGFSLTVALATVTYHLIEVPAQNLGRRLMQGMNKPEPASDAS